MDFPFCSLATPVSDTSAEFLAPAARDIRGKARKAAILFFETAIMKLSEKAVR